jgi:MarR family 2-MHQ and catechol resistance regulon transcriptional repressor
MSNPNLVAAYSEEPAARDWSADQDIALRLWATLWRCHATCAKAMAAQVQEYDLTTPQFVVLEALHHLGSLPLGELAEKLLVTGGNVTYVMDRLEEKGLVSRFRPADDRRVVLAQLTPSGRRQMGEVFPNHVSRMEHLSRHLTSSEQKDLARLLKKMGMGIRHQDL